MIRRLNKPTASNGHPWPTSSTHREVALATTLREHPTVIHATSLGDESLLQYTVRKKSAPRVETLLSARCRFGLIQDPKGHSALQSALKNERKHVVRMLLHAITHTVGARRASAAGECQLLLRFVFVFTLLRFVFVIEPATQSSHGQHVVRRCLVL